MSSASAGNQNRSSACRVGLCIGPERVVATALQSTLGGLRVSQTVSRSVAPPVRDAWPALADCLRQVVDSLECRGARATVALRVPIAHAKIVSVPPLRGADLQLYVDRNIRRFFLVGDAPVFTDAELLGTPRQADTTPALVLCADQGLVRAVFRAAEGAGLELTCITAAAPALAEAVRRHVQPRPRDTMAIAICTSDWQEGLLVHRGRLMALTAWPSSSVQDAIERERHVAALVAGAPDGATVETLVLGFHGQTASGSSDSLSPAATLALPPQVPSQPEVLAALGSVLLGNRAPMVGPMELRVALRRRAVRRVSMLGVAAVLLLVAGAVTYWWGLGRELAAVRAQQEAVAADVARTLGRGQDLESMRNLLSAIARAEATARSWTAVLAALAQSLPDSAHLVSLAARGDHLSITGFGGSSSTLVPVLEDSPLFRDVRLNAAVRGDGVDGRERFEIELLIDWKSAAAASHDARSDPGS